MHENLWTNFQADFISVCSKHTNILFPKKMYILKLNFYVKIVCHMIFFLFYLSVPNVSLNLDSI